jgi:hypothetical protein
MITSLTVPTTSPTTRVPLTLIVNETPFSYLIIDGPTPKDGAIGAMPPPPLSTDARWISGTPTSYNFSGIGSRTLFVWVKDLAGNVSYPQITTVNIAVCPQFMPPPGGWCNGGETIPGGVDANGCQLPPTCKPIVVNKVCPQSLTLEGITYTLSPCNIDISMTDGQGNLSFSTTIIPNNLNSNYGFSVYGY